MNRSSAASAFTYSPRKSIIHSWGEGISTTASMFLLVKFVVFFSAVVLANIVHLPSTLAGVLGAWGSTVAVLVLVNLVAGEGKARAVLQAAKMPLLFWTVGGVVITFIGGRASHSEISFVSILVNRFLIYPTRLLMSLGFLAGLFCTTRLSTLGRTPLLPRPVREFSAVFLAALPIALERVTGAYQSLRSRGIDVLPRWPILGRQYAPTAEKFRYLVTLLASVVQEMLYHVGTGILLGVKLRQMSRQRLEIGGNT